MTKISYHASHEQFKPSRLLNLSIMAEQAGFKGVLSSDHFHPWSTEQGQSGFAWSWLGAAMAKTNITFGVVNAPGQRYHPAIIAQAAATLAEMFPERFWVALGSGQAINERITGTYWPTKTQRNERLRECVEIIRALWDGETVNYEGYVTVDEAKLYTRPVQPPLIVGAAITTETAGWVGSWADAMITVSHPIEQLKKMIEAFQLGGGENKPLKLKLQLSYAPSEQEALQGAFKEWKTNIFQSKLLSELHTPEQFEVAAEFFEPEIMKEHVKISSDPGQHVKWINEFIDLGFEEIILHNVNTNQEQFIDIFGNKVLPELNL
jgi:coenzyme F420-dependent glucose-6-phosphate dehydrogenase